MKSYSPLRYPGGKSKTYDYIKLLIKMNKCTSYIEPFAGGAGVALKLLLNGDVKRIIINDYDRSIFAFWYSVLYETEEIIDRIRKTDITMETWYKQKEVQKRKDSVSLIDLGFSTLFLNRTNRSGIIKAGVIGGKNQNGIYKMDCRFSKEDIIKKIKNIAIYRDFIQVNNMDAIDFIDKIIPKTRNSFTFFDPPYFNKGPSLYTNFYSENDHLILSEKIKKTLRNRKWIVTYDMCDQIKKMYNDLNYIEFYLTYTAQRKTQGKEYMFFSKKTKVPSNQPLPLKIVFNS
ncbi:DNA adenine methylase [Bacillus subtilis]|nr:MULTISPECIES: DNA adenine methylase [Bacillus]MCP8625529.1 DNA adenine methylase [Bacillus subtilis]MDC6144123.1 DNA adenine methylase [Bacillus subtilis]MDQ2204739.1 DNA adenine methylase [Bacillus sp. WR13]MEC1792223.1 DNA adenine methylase [Bacillus vallismortis]MED1981206.1 DNA adenine methylase [Bacillus subtilis]